MSGDEEVSPEFKRLVDAAVAAGHTCQSVLLKVNERISATPPGTGRDNLINFRRMLMEKIKTEGPTRRPRIKEARAALKDAPQ
jgi:hypothetical protein